MKHPSLLPEPPPYPRSRLGSLCKKTYLGTQFPNQEVRALWRIPVVLQCAGAGARQEGSERRKVMHGGFVCIQVLISNKTQQGPVNLYAYS